jgi:hypothetical protein
MSSWSTRAGASFANTVGNWFAKLTDAIQPWIGTPYVFGGSSHTGVDRSGFTQAVFAAIGVLLVVELVNRLWAGSAATTVVLLIVLGVLAQTVRVLNAEPPVWHGHRRAATLWLPRPRRRAAPVRLLAADASNGQAS